MGKQTDTDTDEILLAQAQREQALAMLSLVESHVAERQETIVRKLVNAYYSGTLSGDDARAGVAGLAEIRKLVSDLRRVAGDSTPG